MIKAAKLIAILASAGLLSSCVQKIDPHPEKITKPCIISSRLPNNTLGRSGVQIIHISNTYRIIIPYNNIFEIQSADIKDSAYPALNSLASYLKNFIPNDIYISSYTDSLGSFPEDLELTENQSRSLLTYLWTKGIPHEYLIPKGIGKDENDAIANNRSIDGSAQNRRIEITFKVKHYGLFASR